MSPARPASDEQLDAATWCRHLVPECALTAATAPDGPIGVKLLAKAEPGLEVLGDSAYGGGQTRAALRAAGHLQTIKPLPLSRAVPGGIHSPRDGAVHA